MKIEENKLRTVVKLDHVTVTITDDELKLTDDEGIMISISGEPSLAISEAITRRMRKG